MYAWMKLAQNMQACGYGHACDVPKCPREAKVVVAFENGEKHLCRAHLLDLLAIVTGECPALMRTLDPESCG